MRLYFLTQLKRANVSQSNLCLLYTSCLRSVMDYASPVFHYALPKCLAYELERVQKRAMRISCPSKDYQQALLSLNLPTIQDHHDEICMRTFNSIINDRDHKLAHLISEAPKSSYNLRHVPKFIVPCYKTNRFRNSFFYIFSNSRQ